MGNVKCFTLNHVEPKSWGVKDGARRGNTFGSLAIRYHSQSTVAVCYDGIIENSQQWGQLLALFQTVLAGSFSERPAGASPSLADLYGSRDALIHTYYGHQL